MIKSFVTLALACTLCMAAGPPENNWEAPKPTPIANVSDLIPIAEMPGEHGPVVVNVLPASVGHKGDLSRVMVIVMTGVDHKGIALPTIVNCKDHTFAIPLVVHLSIGDKGEVVAEDTGAVGPKTSSFTSTSEGTWGAKVEQFVCTGVVPKFVPGTAV